MTRCISGPLTSPASCIQAWPARHAKWQLSVAPLRVCVHRLCPLQHAGCPKVFERQSTWHLGTKRSSSAAKVGV